MQVPWNVHSRPHETSLNFLFRPCFTESPGERKEETAVSINPVEPTGGRLTPATLFVLVTPVVSVQREVAAVSPDLRLAVAGEMDISVPYAVPE